MTSSDDINENTGLPHTLSLGDVLADIELAPAQITAFLHSLAYPHLGGGPNDALGRALIQHGNNVSDPATYGNADPNAARNPQANWNNPTPGAQQGQAALPATGGANEPSWMADARASGWRANDDRPDSARIAEAGQPQFNQPARHYDNERGQWVDNQTGQPVDVSSGTPTRETETPPTPPPTTL